MRRLLTTGLVPAFLVCAAVAHGALVKIGDLVLTADGGFTPRQLPAHSYKGIDFEGHFDVRTTDGIIPPALQQVVVNFDHDGRLSTAGLPTCDPSLLQEATPAEARARCRGAIVGTGHVGALIPREGQPPVDATSELTLFNGPPEEGHPTVILHARTTEPATQSFVVTIPVERRRGEYRYRATIDVPPIDAGRGSLVHLDVDVGRRYRFGGKQRSYVSARCSDHVLDTRGRFTFADGTVIEGSVLKACIPR